MRTKKTVTEKVVTANRQNAQESCGARTPRGKRAVARNARTHELLAKTLVFKNEEEEAQFNAL